MGNYSNRWKIINYILNNNFNITKAVINVIFHFRNFFITRTILMIGLIFCDKLQKKHFFKNKHENMMWILSMVINGVKYQRWEIKNHGLKINLFYTIVSFIQTIWSNLFKIHNFQKTPLFKIRLSFKFLNHSISRTWHNHPLEIQIKKTSRPVRCMK